MAGMFNGEWAADKMGIGERPSESHHWIPGYGWTFMPTYEEGNSLSDQSKANPNQSFDIAVDAKSKADAEASGVKSFRAAHQPNGLTREDRRAIQQRQTSQYWYSGGMDHFNPSREYTDASDYTTGDWHKEASDYFQSIGAPQAITPWWHDKDDARMGTFNAIKEDNYNPFIGNEGAWVTPEGNDQRGSNNGTAEGYRDDSISAYLKHAFSGEDQVKNRADALRAFKKWNGTERGVNPATTRMHQRYFDELGLADFGMEYEGKAAAPVGFVPQDVSGGWNPGGMMTGGARPLHSDDTGMMIGGEPNPNVDRVPISPNVGGGNFMAAYQAKRDELASKPSVMSLMTELKDA